MDKNIQKQIDESNYRYNLRVNFIKILQDKNYNLKESIILSKYWYNIKFNKCKYNKEIYYKIITLDPTLKIS
jgi:hypothetical protein